MKLTARDRDQQNSLAHAFHDRERFVLTGAGLQAEFVAEVLNRVPCVFGSGRYETNLELVQVTEATTQVAWTGEGLPTVGTVCEMQNATGIWRQVEIFANFKGNVFGWDGGELVNYISCDTREFRPIRTPEQIAAEDREAAIDDMVSHVKSGIGLRALCEQVFDSGYRKQ